MKLNDSITEALEKRSLWRRAARRWLIVMGLVTDEDEREAIVSGRQRCITMRVIDGGETADCTFRPNNKVKFQTLTSD